MKKIIEGVPVSSGKVKGKVRILDDINNISQIDKSNIIVVTKSHPKFATFVMDAAGLICEVGGGLAHLCIIALEMGIPCITQAYNATKILYENEEILLDATEGVVYGREK